MDGIQDPSATSSLVGGGSARDAGPTPPPPTHSPSSPAAEDDDAEKTGSPSAEELLARQLESDDAGKHGELNFSSQGLTMAPSSLFLKTHITVLNLSSNNIRGLPAEISHLVNLRRLDLSRNGLRCAHSKDFTSLPKEMETMTSLKELLLSECSLMHIPPAVWSIASLERLDVSRNKVGLIPPDIMKLERLVHLNATQTGVKTLPEEIVCCDLLETILLFGNPIDSLPDTLRELTRLHTLHINFRVFASAVDSETDGMLQRQQLTSEHIPSVVFHIPRLYQIDLESCKVNSLPRSLTRSLVELNIAANYFSSFPEAVCSLRSLTVLDVSRNSFKFLPAALKDLRSLRVLLARENQLGLVDVVAELTELERLDLSFNAIVRLPDGIGQLERLGVLLLPGNRLEVLPQSLCQLTRLQTLDLTGNRLTAIPPEMSAMAGLDNSHEFNGLFKRGLWLHKNPIEKPPPKVWNTWDPAKIWGYMKRMEIQNVPKLRPCKLVFLGDHGCGKTSLSRILRFGHPAPTHPDGSDYTRGFEVSAWRSENLCPFVLLEAAGHPIFRPLVTKLLDPRAVHFVVFDLAKYVQAGFESAGRWLRLLASFVPEARVQLIGTKLDLVVAAKKNSDIGIFVEHPDKIINEEDDAPPPPPLTEEGLLASLQDDLRGCLDSLAAEESGGLKLRLMPDIRLVSAVREESARRDGGGGGGGLLGLSELRRDMERLSADREAMPHLQKYVPTNWKPFAELVKRQPGLYLHWEAVVSLGEERNLRDAQLQECIEYYAESGQLIWLRRHPRLRQVVFHRPERLQDYLGRLLPTRLAEFLADYDGNALFRSCGKFSAGQFAEAREAALTRGQLSWPMIRCLAFGRGGDRQMLVEALHCLEFLELGCCTMPPEVPQPGLHSRPVLTIPYLLTTLPAATVAAVDSPEEDKADEEADGNDNLPEAEFPRLSAGCPHRCRARLRCPPGRQPPALFPCLAAALHSAVAWRLDAPGRLLCELDHCQVLAVEVDTDEADLSSGVDFQMASQSEVKMQSAVAWLRGYADCLGAFAPGLQCRFIED